MRQSTSQLIARDPELYQVLDKVMRCQTSLLAEEFGFSVSGPEGIGKTRLLSEIKRVCGSTLWTIPVAPDLVTTPWRLDPLVELYAVRRSAAKAFNGFQCPEFDLAYQIFKEKFPSDDNLSETLELHAELPGIFAESFLDVLKKGGEDALQEFKSLALSWMQVSAAAGTVAAGTAAGGTALKVVGDSFTITSLASLSASALIAGTAGLAAGFAFALSKHLIRGARIRSRLTGIRALVPEFDDIVFSPDENRPEYMRLLCRLLADALMKCHDKDRGCIPIFYVDPTDDFDARSDKGPEPQVLKTLTQLFDGARRKIVVVTSRETDGAWLARASAMSLLPQLNYMSIMLSNIPLDALHVWLDSRGLAPSGAWPPRDLNVCANHTIDPRDLGIWWDRSLKGQQGAQRVGDVA